MGRLSVRLKLMVACRLLALHFLFWCRVALAAATLSVFLNFVMVKMSKHLSAAVLPW